MSGKPVTNKQSSDDQVRKKNYSIKKGGKKWNGKDSSDKKKSL